MRRASIILGALALFTSSAFGAITLESGCSASTDQVTTVTCTTGALSVGDAILVDVTYFGGTITSYTDNSSSLTPISGSLATSTQTYGTGNDSVFYLQNAAAGTHTITITFSTATGFPSLVVNGMRGVDTTQAIESFSLTNGASNGTILTASAISTVTANAAIVAFGQVANGSATISAGSGYTISPFTPGINAQSEYAVQATAGSYTPTFGVSGATGSGWEANAIGLKLAPVSGSLTASSSTILQNTTGNVINLTCTGCTWSPGTPGTPTFTVTGSGVAITAQQVLTSTTATVTLSAGIPVGPLAINDPVTGNSAILSIVPFTACTASDAFTGSGPLNTANWTQTTATTNVSALDQISGSAIPATASTQGMAIWKGSSCSPPADQYSQVTLTGAITLPNSTTGPMVRASASGNGYIWNLSSQSIETLNTPLVRTRQVAQNCNASTPVVGSTYMLVARGVWFYAYQDGVLKCKGGDGQYTSGSPGFQVDRTSGGTTDAAGSFSAGSSTLFPPTFSYNTGTYGFSPVVTIASVNNAKICYTLDGSPPTAPLAGTCSGGTTQTYSSALTISTGETLNAITTTFGLTNSPVTSATYAIRTGAAKTWYVDAAIGGTRFSTNQTAGLCDGTVDSAPVGTTPNQHCAFSDARMLWQDGSASDGSTFPGWGWIGAGGDTYIVKGSIADGVTYRVGWATGSNACDSSGCWGMVADATGSGAPPFVSGSPTNHTKFLGGNFASCTAQTARTQLHGGWSVGDVINFTEGVSYVDAACLDITDFSACSSNGVHQCAAGTDDFATLGIIIDNLSTNDTISHVRLHGLKAGIEGSTGDNVTMTDLQILGNSNSGWNADLGNGSTGVGHLNVTNFNISWNGCAEEYPIVDALPYQDCTDANYNGGYGDGWGTTTVQSAPPGWQVHFDQGIASYNTQDGLDALHISGPGSSVIHSRVLAYGNMGQQLKVGGAAATIQNSLINGNCEAMGQGTSWFPGSTGLTGLPTGWNSNLSLFCRAGGTAILVNTTPGDPLVFQNNTVFDSNSIGLEVEYATPDIGSTNTILYDNNICVSFLNVGSGSQSNCIFSSIDGNMFTNPGASWTNNSYWNPKVSCPQTGETHAICTDPKLVDETYHPLDYGNMTPTSSSPLVGAGVFLLSVPLDYNGVVRPNPPSIGALEFAGASQNIILTIGGKVVFSGNVVIR